MALLNQVSTAVNDLSLHQALLIHFARTLYNFDKGLHELHAEATGVTVNELLLVDGHHLCYVSDEVKGLVVQYSIVDLLSQEVLHIGMMAFGEKLKKSQ